MGKTFTYIIASFRLKSRIFEIGTDLNGELHLIDAFRALHKRFEPIF